MDTNKLLEICTKINDLAKQGIFQKEIAGIIGMETKHIGVLNSIVKFEWKPKERKPSPNKKTWADIERNSRQRSETAHALRLEGKTLKQVGISLGVGPERARGLIARQQRILDYKHKTGVSPEVKLFYDLSVRAQNCIYNEYSERRDREDEGTSECAVSNLISEFESIGLEKMRLKLLVTPNCGRKTVNEILWFLQHAVSGIHIPLDT